MTPKQEATLLHKVDIVCNLLELYLQEQWKPEPVKQEQMQKPKRSYDHELNKIDYKLIRKWFDEYDREQKKKQLSSEQAKLKQIAENLAEINRWQRFLALNPPKPRIIEVTRAPPVELIRKIEAYIAKAESFIKQHQGDLPTIEEFRKIDAAVDDLKQFR